MPPNSEGRREAARLVLQAEKFNAAGNANAAFAAWSRVRELCRDDPSMPPSISAMCSMNLGIFAKRGGRYLEAESHLAEARIRFEAMADATAIPLCDQELGGTLYRLGRLREAEVHLTAAVAGYEALAASGQPDAAAEAAGSRVSLGLVLLNSGRAPGAAGLFTEAARVFAANGMVLQEADCEANLGVAARHAGALRDAAVHFARGEVAYMTVGAAASAAECAAQLAEILLEQDERRGGVEASARAGELFLRAGDNRQAAACLLVAGKGYVEMLGSWAAALAPLRRARDLYGSLHEVGGEAIAGLALADALGASHAYPEAVAEARRARRCCSAGGAGDLVGECDLRIAAWLRRIGDLRGAWETLAMPRARFADREGDPRFAMCLAEAAELSLAGADGDRDTGQALGLLIRARDIFERNDDKGKLAACDWRLGKLLRRRLDVAGSIAALERALDLYRSYPHVLHAAQCSLSLARTLHLAARLDDQHTGALAATGLTHAVEGLAVLDAFRYELETAPHRAAWARAHDLDFETTAQLAALVDDRRLLAELVETARAQALPAQGAPGEEPVPELDLGLRVEPARPAVEIAESDRARALSALGDLSLGPAPAVSVGGLSVLGQAGGRRRPEVVLEEVLVQSAGREAWWWGTWIFQGTLRYALVGRDGVIEAGVLDAERLGPLLAELRDALPNPRPGETVAQAVERAGRGPLGDDAGAEASLAERLGSALLPPLLREELAGRSARDPLALAVAPAPSLGRVPWALLSLGGRRLVDASIVRLVPSAALAQAVLNRSTPPRGVDRDVKLVVVDPTGDLGCARRLPQRLTAARVLTGCDASRQAMVAELPTASGQRGIMVYSGHVFAGEPGAPTTAALCLHAGPGASAQGGLTARDLLEARGPRVWDRVLLSGCSSAGAEAGAEWLGLAPALLWAGADTVVATAWDLLDSDHTTELEVDLVETLRNDDPVAGVRAVQAERLDAWRGAPAGKRRVTCPPAVFGAYAAVSVCPGPSRAKAG